jgi:DNA-binding GntR family transcriptional regulator
LRDITEEMVTALGNDRAALTQASTAERVAELLRTRIMEGVFPPGTRLSEEAIGHTLGISRNTLREAFRLLCHERVAVHLLNRGIFVPVLTTADVVDIFAVRRLVEGGAARMAKQARAASRLAVVAAAEDGDQAAAEGRWFDCRTADLHFHLAISGLAESPRVDELMRRALAELRLVFHTMRDPEEFHAPYLGRNLKLAELIADGNGEAAYQELLHYLDDAERQVLAAYASDDGSEPQPVGA